MGRVRQRCGRLVTVATRGAGGPLPNRRPAAGNGGGYAGRIFQSPKVAIGRRSFVNRGVKFYNGHAAIDIGDFVQVGIGVTILTDTHPIGGPRQRCSSMVTSLPVRIGNGCWIGANATILPGVTIGPGCVIAAGAVVIRDCDSDGMYAGVPARRVRTFDDVTSDP